MSEHFSAHRFSCKGHKLDRCIIRCNIAASRYTPKCTGRPGRPRSAVTVGDDRQRAVTRRDAAAPGLAGPTLHQAARPPEAFQFTPTFDHSMRFFLLVVCVCCRLTAIHTSTPPCMTQSAPNIGASSAGYFVTYLPQELRTDIDVTQFGDLIVLDNNSTPRSSLIWLHGHGSSGASISSLLGKHLEPFRVHATNTIITHPC